MDDILEEYNISGIINLIDYGDFVHVCLNPRHIAEFEKEVKI